MEGVLAITFIFGGGTLFLLAISPVGKALADRIRGRVAGPDPTVLDELEHLRNELADVQERLDFAERLLAHQDRTALPAERAGSGDAS